MYAGGSDEFGVDIGDSLSRSMRSTKSARPENPARRAKHGTEQK